MPNFNYEAIDKSGRIFYGELVAINEKELSQKLSDLQLALVRCRLKWNQSRNASQNRIGRQQLIEFCYYLDQQLMQGKSIPAAIATIHEQCQHTNFREVLSVIKEELHRGKKLSQALAMYPQVFSTIFVNLIRAGDENKRLIDTLRNLMLMLERQEKLSNEIRRKWFFPLTIGFLTLTTVFCLKTCSIYTGVLILMSTAMGVYFAYTLVNNNHYSQLKLMQWLSNIPYIGSVFRNMLLSQLSHYLALTYRAQGHCFSESDLNSDNLEICLDDYIYKQGQQFIHSAVLAKDHDYTCLFPQQMVDIIIHGERQNRLAKVLRKVHEFYYRNSLKTIQKAYAIIEPVLIILVALTLAYFGLALIFPKIYGISFFI